MRHFPYLCFPMILKNNINAAESSDDSAFSSSDLLKLAVGHARCIYAELAITDGWPALLGFHGTEVKVLRPLPFNERHAQKWAVAAEITWFLDDQSCDKAAVVYPISIRSLTVDGSPEGELVLGLLVVAHEAKRPDQQAFLPLLKRAGSCNVLGEAIMCTGLEQGITYRDLLRGPPQN